MTTYTFYNDTAANGTTPTTYVDTDGIRGMYGAFQVSKTGAGTFTAALQGRLSSDHDWFEIHSATDDEAVEVTIFPQMRLVISDVSGTSTLVATIIVPKAWN